MTLYVFGASDDLIETEGLISDEFNPPYGKAARFVVAVDGAPYVSLRVEYDPDESGEWRIASEGPFAPLKIAKARGEDAGDDEHGCPGYSDLASIDLSGFERSRVAIRIEDAA